MLYFKIVITIIAFCLVMNTFNRFGVVKLPQHVIVDNIDQLKK